MIYAYIKRTQKVEDTLYLEVNIKNIMISSLIKRQLKNEDVLYCTNIFIFLC